MSFVGEIPVDCCRSTDLLTTGASVNLFKSSAVCVVVAICGCDQGQPTVTVPDSDPWKKRAVAGDADAQFMLGMTYGTGMDVTLDHSKAFKWHRLASEQGFMPSQAILGWQYERGLGVQQNDVEAYAWSAVAVSGGHPDAAETRDAAAAKLNQKQLSDAKKRAAELLKKYGSRNW